MSETTKATLKNADVPFEYVGDAKIGTVNERPCIQASYLSPKSTGDQICMEESLIPVGDAVYQLLILYAKKEREKASALFTPIRSSVKIDAVAQSAAWADIKTRGAEADAQPSGVGMEGKTHRLAQGISLTLPHGWKVSAAKPGTKARITKEPTRIFSAVPPENTYSATFDVHVRLTPPGMVEALRSGPEAVAAYFRVRAEVLRKDYAKRGIKLLRAAEAEMLRAGGFDSVAWWHVITKESEGRSINVFTVSTPVGETMYEFSLTYEHGKDKEASNTFVPIIESLVFEPSGAAQGAAGRQDSRKPAPGGAETGGAFAPGDEKTLRPNAGEEAADMRVKMDRLRHMARDIAP